MTTHRDATPIEAFFAQIFGKEDFKRKATAVAYIGFAGSFEPFELEIPVAICIESITKIVDGKQVFDCNIGRMINSGNDSDTNNTAGWTDFDQSEECNGVNANVMTDVITCDNLGGNQDFVEAGYLETGGGQIQSVFTALTNCWETKSDGKTKSWSVKLPVIKCPGNNIGTCSELVGGVTVEIVWITGGGEDPAYNDAPTVMDGWDWSSQESDVNGDGSIDGKDRWASFVDHFHLKNVDDSDAPYAKKSIYFKPSCNVAIPSGGTGGENLGVLAKFPVLVD